MTSLIIAMFIVSFYVLFIVFKRTRTTSAFIVKIVVLFVTLLMLLVSLYVIDPSLVGPEGFNKITGRDITLTGRWKLWQRGFSLFLEKPVFGWSYDVLLSVFAKNNITQGQFHNGYLDLAIRGGLMGFFLFFVVLVRFMRSLKRLIASNYECALMYLALLFGILIHNISEASFVRAPNILWLLFLVLYFHSEELVSSSIERSHRV